jgi:ComF family protein
MRKNSPAGIGSRVKSHGTQESGNSEWRNSSPPYKATVAACAYEGLLRELIWRFKYKAERRLARPLGSLLALRLEGEAFMKVIDRIVPVPLFWRKRVSRGFNQAELLAKRVARNFGVPLSPRILKRKKSTQPLYPLGGIERRKELAGAFQIRSSRRIRGKRVLVIDDLMTTGTTLQECARVLSEAGAAAVYCAVLGGSPS